LAHFDLIVLGGGSGSVACARRAGSYGAKVAVCEDNRVGGTCVIRGCIPKKLMLYGAVFQGHFRAARGYGWEVQARLDWRALIEARDREIDRLNGVYIGMLEKAGVQLIRARGRITAANAVEAGGQIHTADRILIAVGARPSLPALPGIEHAITSDDALERMAQKPGRLAVIGAGYIGVELASILHGLGVETSLILRRDLPLRGFDTDLRESLLEELRGHGLEVRPETTVRAIERTADGVVLESSAGRLAYDAVLYATGREPIPNTRGIGLEELGVRMEPGGAIQVDADYQSSVPGIYAVGDCSDHAGSGLDSGSFDLTPVAIAEGRTVAERHFNDNPCVVRYESIPTAVFGIPEAAAVGLTEERAYAFGHDVAIYRTRFRPLLHTLTAEPSRTMGLAVAMTAGATKAQFDDTVGLHPTAAEEFVTMYQETA
jgi:glutathione reductase (NADPH)